MTSLHRQISAHPGADHDLEKGHPPQHVATKVCSNEFPPQPQSLQSGPTVAGEYFACWRLGLGALWRKIETNETLAVLLNHALILRDASVRLAAGHYDVGAGMFVCLFWMQRHLPKHVK